jgi:putative oligomerization/nucleic acid binding protein
MHLSGRCKEEMKAAPTGLTDESITQLKQLGQLHESGVLTDEEFEASKKKILGI